MKRYIAIVLALMTLIALQPTPLLDLCILEGLVVVWAWYTPYLYDTRH